MAGHSKFKNIMHRKGAQDAKRAKIFTRLGKELSVAVKMGADPESNSRLRTAIASCRSANMPNDNIQKVLKKAEMGDGLDYVDIRYEGYGPQGTAFILEALTDNKNRTASEVRSTFSKLNGNLAELGSVSYLFQKIGYICFPLEACDPETFFEVAIDFGAIDVISENKLNEVFTETENFISINEKLINKFGEAVEASIIWKPNEIIYIKEKDSETIVKLYEALDEIEDVQNVYSNFEFS